MENHTVISKGFHILRDMLAPYIGRELSLEHGSNIWWREGVMNVLYDDQKRNLPQTGDFATLTDSLDVFACLLLFDLHWQYIFKKKLSIDHRTWAKELVSFRNKVAHIGGKDFTDDDTWRALDTMSRLAEQIEPESAEEIRALYRASRYGSENGSTTVVSASVPVEKINKDVGILESSPSRGLPSWRDVIEPHPDVAQGRYKNAEFAADLAQVARSEGAMEYLDPVEFFNRTFVTEGMSGLLEQSLRRICDKDGEPVIQLKTAFGGGKTHSMLALYHMMRGRVHIDKIPNVKPVLERAGVSSLPRANVAVLVGTALNPTKSKARDNMPGITVHTLWGEMAAQLAESAGKPSLYDYVKESDEKGVSPGSEVLKNLFNDAAPCLVLMDELVAYAKKLYGVNSLPAGTFDNFISFIQEVTEAARASKNSLVVASIPESDIEIGGEAGKTALATIEHTFGRMESIWKPVAANEGFEIVRRRLFLNCKKPEGRDDVCAAFSKMYKKNDSIFPIETKELEYKEQMVSCYPIHPEVFDRLYKDWSTLERFQRTRGVLRLMAAVVYELWMSNDASLLIMPGSIPLDVPIVRDELTRHLPENWNAIVDSEVDGKNSIPYKTDKNGRFGRQLAARRVARTIMLGSAPTSREQATRGIESSRIQLGVVQPGENIAVFSDALNTLRNILAFLYTNPSGDRYWYDNRPTLRKTAEDRAQQIAPPDIEYEIEQRLELKKILAEYKKDVGQKKISKEEQPFEGIHSCPASSNDVPDEQSARLVILRPSDEYKASRSNNSAMSAVEEILNNRGNSPRIYRNTLAFIAPDQDLMTSLKQEVSRFLAWKSIKEDSVDLNLDAAQNRETEKNLSKSSETVDSRIKEAYCWLFVPFIDLSESDEEKKKKILWDIIRISGGKEHMITKAAKKMLQNEAIITKWAPTLLMMELDKLLWRESENISIKKLWEYLCSYCYLPRLSNETVLEEAIRTGLNSSEYFAYASGLDGTRYMDLKFNQYVGTIDRSGYLVKVSAAQKQLAEQNEPAQPKGSPAPEPNEDKKIIELPFTDAEELDEVELPKNTYFFMTTQLDTTRIGRDVARLVEEVIRHLTSVEGAQVDLSLEMSVNAPTGLSPQVVRTVSENCRTLRVKDFGFDS